MKYQNFSFSKNSYLHRAQWRYYFYLSRVRILVSPWLQTWLANYKRSCSGARSALLKKNCISCRNFISFYKINRILHGRLRIRILSLEDKIRKFFFTHLLLFYRSFHVFLTIAICIYLCFSGEVLFWFLAFGFISHMTRISNKTSFLCKKGY